MKVIEFLGDGRAGKSTQVKLLVNYLKDKGLKVKTISDREILNKIDVPYEKAYEFNMAQFRTIKEFIEDNLDLDVIILDRGFTDAEMWFTLKHDLNEMTDEQRDDGIKFTKEMREKYFDIGFLMLLEPKLSLKRHHATEERDTGDDVWYTMDFLNALHGAYLKLLPKYEEDPRIFILDGTKSVEENFEIVKEKLKPII
jgi:thymidylate kinase